MTAAYPAGTGWNDGRVATRLTDGWRLALGTLTVIRVPPPQRVDVSVAKVAALLAPVAFAPVAILIGLLGWAAASVLPGLVAGLLLVGVTAWVTRAIHLDGLADTADGLGSGRPAPRALEIMKRGDVGPMGVVTLVVVLGLQAASAGALLGRPWGWLVVGVALAVGRGALVLAASGAPAARPDGLGAVFASSVPTWAAWGLWVVQAAALSVVAVLGRSPWWLGVLAAGAGAAMVLYVVAAARRRIGGITGDVLGAGVELAVAAVLVVLAAW